jgi:dTDP-4-dehydrorhamnose reductase
VRILVTGAAGQLGTDLVRHCAERGDDVVACDAEAFDLGDRGAVMGAITTVAPDVVVNAGAWTAVDACEADPGRAWRVNGLGPRWVAEGCRATGAHLVQLSTDYVFDGTKDGPYVEWDRPNPLSAYGRSKLAGEQEALEGCPGAAIVRTSWVCGAAGRNVVRTVVERAAAGEPLAFVDDQRGRPTFSADLAVAVRRLAVGRARGDERAVDVDVDRDRVAGVGVDGPAGDGDAVATSRRDVEGAEGRGDVEGHHGDAAAAEEAMRAGADVDRIGADVTGTRGGVDRRVEPAGRSIAGERGDDIGTAAIGGDRSGEGTVDIEVHVHGAGRLGVGGPPGDAEPAARVGDEVDRAEGVGGNGDTAAPERCRACAAHGVHADVRRRCGDGDDGVEAHHRRCARP